MDHNSSPRWVWLAGLGHLFVAQVLQFSAIHPLRDALDAHNLAVLQTMCAVQTANGLGLMLLALRGTGKVAALLIALGTLLAAGMIWVIVFIGTHPFDAAVPLGGMLFLAGWLVVLWQALKEKPNG
jgi:uncharacterized membrane protein YgdD (TMEM256/DUF423 family)